MKQMNFPLLLLIALFSLNAGCKKENSADSLPPITQTGANSFGCLINGNVFVPKGYVPTYYNYRLIVDPTFYDGNFELSVYMVKSDSVIRITIVSDSLRGTGNYPLSDFGKFHILFSKFNKSMTHQYCECEGNAIYNRSGYLKITRYDLQNRIFSGEFEATIYNPACGYGNPIRITQGRFDKQL